jgi:hypothetical protein
MVCFYGWIFSVIQESYLGHSYQTAILIDTFQFCMKEFHYHMQQKTTQ